MREEEPQTKTVNTVGAVALLFLAVVIGGVLFFSRSDVEITPRIQSGELVEVIEAEVHFSAPRIVAQGTVVPARRVTIRPEVSGRIVERHPGLVDGGVVQRGETVLRIDPRDYQLAVDEARNGVEAAQAELAMEEGRQVVAQQEWERFGSGDEEPPPLALREPQLQQARLDIDRAQHQLTRALLDLERTRLRAPFAGLVTEASVEVGELATPSLAAATLVGLDEFWVQVSVPVDTLNSLAIPGRDGDRGSRAFVRHHGAAGVVEHQGEIIRLLGDLDPAGRMARVLVRVVDPFSLAADEGEPDMPALRKQPLMLGSYVSVEFEGAHPRNVVELPREALHDGQWVYVATESDRLELREVQTVWRTRDTIAVAEGIEEGERIVVSGLAAPVEGMALRVEQAPEGYFSPSRGEVVSADREDQAVESPLEPRIPEVPEEVGEEDEFGEEPEGEEVTEEEPVEHGEPEERSVEETEDEGEREEEDREDDETESEGAAAEDEESPPEGE